MIEDIKYKCNELFDFYAVLKAEPLTDDTQRWRNWIENNRHGQLKYMERERSDLQIIMPSVRSVVVAAVPYPNHCEKPGVARCFTGGDYHDRVKEKLYELLNFIKHFHPPIKGRAVVDTAPALEKAWAVRGGIGWIGRNSLLITDKGSFYNLGLLLLDIDLPEVKGSCTTDKCGSCQKCIDACPTDALTYRDENDRTIDVPKCISYLTMEARRIGIEHQNNKNIHGWIQGCDTCQECCPWNKKGR